MWKYASSQLYMLQMTIFAENISPRNVATAFTYDRMFNNQFTTNLSVKELLKSVYISHSYSYDSDASFLHTQCTIQNNNLGRFV